MTRNNVFFGKANYKMTKKNYQEEMFERDSRRRSQR